MPGAILRVAEKGLAENLFPLDALFQVLPEHHATHTRTQVVHQ